MERIREWLNRLESASDGSLRHNVCRALVPGVIGMQVEEPYFETAPLGFVGERPGDGHPIHLLQLRFLDTVPLSVETTALASELAAILGIASGTFIEVPLELPISAPPDPRAFFLGFADALDRRLANPPTSDFSQALRQILDQIRNLDARDAQTLGAAARLHYSSCALATRDSRAAYLLLVAGIETLSRRYGQRTGGWAAVEPGQRRRWEKLFTKFKLNSEQADAVRNELGGNSHLQLKATFCSYVVSALPESFWNEEWLETSYSRIVPAGGWVGPKTELRKVETFLSRDRAILHQALSTTYNFRSKLVHEGAEASLLQIGMRAGVMVNRSDPLPYPVLRAILVALIRQELAQATAEVTAA